MASIRARSGTTVPGGRYRLREAVGAGGMASVWLAEDVRLGREVAVKLLSEGLASDPAFVARFGREARVAASLRHPNLVGVFDFDPGATPPYMVMEYVPGPNLAQRLEEGTPPSIERLAGDLLAALDAIHRAGVVHRDVKPQNVLLAPSGRAMLTDFGIARPEGATSLTQTGLMPGTARYMAPELLEGQPATPASDLYACGILLGECLAHVDEPALHTLATRLSAADAADRPGSAAAALEELLHPRPRFEPPVAAATDGSSREGRTIHLDRSWLVAGAVLAAVAVLAAILIAGSGDDEPVRSRADAGGDRAARSAGEGAGEDGADPSPTGGGDGSRSIAAIPVPAGEPDPARGAALNQEGYQLLQAGRPEEAVGILRDAAASFEAGTDDLNYAYALFNYGQALRQAGRPEKAIPVLRRRLEIPNQTEAVKAELDAALAAAD